MAEDRTRKWGVLNLAAILVNGSPIRTQIWFGDFNAVENISEALGEASGEVCRWHEEHGVASVFVNVDDRTEEWKTEDFIRNFGPIATCNNSALFDDVEWPSPVTRLSTDHNVYVPVAVFASPVSSYGSGK